MTYSANDNQNFFVQSGRTTSRVLAQPGGASSIFLGGWTPEELERQRQRREGVTEAPVTAPTPVAEKENPTAETKEEIKAVADPEEKPVDTDIVSNQNPTQRPISSNAFASASSTNSFNVITDRPTSRVTAPPGGHCSIRLG